MNKTELAAALAKEGDLDISKVIQQLKSGRKLPDVKLHREQFDPSGHNTMDPTKRKDKQVKKLNSEGVEENTIEKVNRLSLSLQKVITERAVSFLFGNPVKILSKAESEKEKQVLRGVNRIFYDNKINSFNRRIAREMFRSTEVAECWFPVETAEKHSDYGFDSKFKVRAVAFNPWDQNELFPHFDETGDMIAFSRAFCRIDDDNKTIKYFETYTDEEKIVWQEDGAGWKELKREPNVIKKIPVVYGHQEQVEWADVQIAIDRLELLLSNFADTNDYHAAPKIFVEGELTGFSSKGESGTILQGTKGTKAEYLSWNQATEAVKLEIETLIRFIYSLTQTPDISFESVKGLNQISGETLKMLFLDAHLKVQTKREIFDEYLQRRINIIKAYISFINTGLKAEASTLEIEAEIQPFIINDEKAMIERLVEANAGKALISQRTATALSGLVDDVDAEYKLLQEEEKRERTFDVTEPTA